MLLHYVQPCATDVGCIDLYVCTLKVTFEKDDHIFLRVIALECIQYWDVCTNMLTPYYTSELNYLSLLWIHEASPVTS